ncbi:MAG: 2-oxoglutarate dehydrogenase, E2 component, dihydrolipoamide succinyltransferase [Pseudonocardiales bacterium]|nr:2-oxoglutarate dehydrogenase, E2 component, dihydrolipoamide succinyltransferase [Pseudonocardiales bacterium]
MAYSVAMPALGESVTEGTVTRWLKQEGDTVDVDEPLVEVSTDKVDTEIPSPAAGVLQRIVVPEDETVKVGAELAVIGESSPQAEAPQPQSTEPQSAQPRPVPPAQRPATPPRAGSGTPVTMPALGESVTSGTVTRWLKQVGDPVDADEPLVEVSTDKVDTEIPSPVAGTVLEIVVPQDETVPIGAALAMVGDRDVATSPPAPDQPERPTEPAPASERAPASESGEPLREHSGAPYVTPLVRKLAAEHGIDLSLVQGTGVGGRIRKQDVLAAVETPEPEPEPQPEPLASQPLPPSQPPMPAMPAPEQQRPAAVAPRSVQPTARAAELRGRTEKMSRMRSVIAKRMVESLQISAQLTTVVEADITRLARLRDRAKRDFEAREGVKLSFLPFFAQATVEALKQHPKVNASIDTEKGEITYHGAEHLGIAVDTERGLLVPVIHDAGDLNIAGLARRIADLAERTRTNKITPDEMSGGTFTLSNTGSRGALFDTPIILQPQVGILGTGSVVKRPVVLSGEDGDTIAVRSITYLALSYDHRLVDGADAARFLNTIKQHLTDAAFERDLGL